MGRKRRVLTPERSAVHRWGSELRTRRDERGLSLAGLSRLARYDASYLGRLERGDQFATLPVAEACNRVLGAGGELVRSWQAADRERRDGTAAAAASGGPVGEMDLRLVSVMPLHAVTAMYGEQGLRPGSPRRWRGSRTQPAGSRPPGRCHWRETCTLRTGGTRFRAGEAAHWND